jgi:hypothetical protein
MILMPMTMLSFLLSGVALLLFRTEGKDLHRFRKILFTLGSIANLASATALALFLIVAHMMSHGTMHPADLDRVYPVLSMLALGLVASVQGFFGRRFSRVLLIVAGFLTICLWYLAVLAVSY